MHEKPHEDFAMSVIRVAGAVLVIVGIGLAVMIAILARDAARFGF